jgi:hypothetical protein
MPRRSNKKEFALKKAWGRRSLLLFLVVLPASYTLRHYKSHISKLEYFSKKLTKALITS